MTDKTYTEDEMQHMLAREVAKQRMGDMQRMIDANKNETQIGFTKLEVQLQQVLSMIEKNNVARTESFESLRREMKTDFATKADVDADFEKLNTKIDTQWQKIALVVGTISVIGGVIIQLVVKFWGH